MLTEFGKFCRKLRIDRGELLKEMADKLGVSAAYLSAVEIGRRNVPLGWPDSIAKLYSLDKDQITSMKETVKNSKLQVKVPLNGLSSDDRTLVLSFAREFKDLDDETKNKIRIALQSRN